MIKCASVPHAERTSLRAHRQTARARGAVWRSRNRRSEMAKRRVGLGSQVVQGMTGDGDISIQL
jgi:hypothetical protein